MESTTETEEGRKQGEEWHPTGERRERSSTPKKGGSAIAKKEQEKQHSPNEEKNGSTKSGNICSKIQTQNIKDARRAEFGMWGPGFSFFFFFKKKKENSKSVFFACVSFHFLFLFFLFACFFIFFSFFKVIYIRAGQR